MARSVNDLVRSFLAQGIAASLGSHIIVIASAYFLLVVRQPDPITVELDLSLAPRIAPFIARSGRARRAPVKKWVLPADGLAPAHGSATESAEEDVVDACPPPCPDRPGDFISTALTKRPPRWVDGFIEEKDYPKVARKRGEDGSVVLRVFIDAAGFVRDVQLLKGSYPILNDTAIRKVRTARFSPALNDSGQPVPAKLILPIRFELY